MSDTRRGASIGLILLVLGVTAATAAYFLGWIPYHAGKSRPENERRADSAIHRLAAAEREFLSADCDRNGILDYWTGDVAGLYVHGSLIDLGIARADPRPVRPLAMLLTPYYGYYFVAMEVDDSASPPEFLKQTTDPASGKVHHRTQFAICAYPADYGRSGKATFIINQDLTAFKRDSGGLPVLRWPSEADIRAHWSKYD